MICHFNKPRTHRYDSITYPRFLIVVSFWISGQKPMFFLSFRFQHFLPLFCQSEPIREYDQEWWWTYKVAKKRRILLGSTAQEAGEDRLKLNLLPSLHDLLSPALQVPTFPVTKVIWWWMCGLIGWSLVVDTVTTMGFSGVLSPAEGKCIFVTTMLDYRHMIHFCISFVQINAEKKLFPDDVEMMDVSATRMNGSDYLNNVR